jgi:antitoxin VapB
MGAPTDIGKVFMSGRSQAVRLPKAFRLETAEVKITRVGRSLVLTPTAGDWADEVHALFDALAREGAQLEREPDWPQPARERLV